MVWCCGGSKQHVDIAPQTPRTRLFSRADSKVAAEDLPRVVTNQLTLPTPTAASSKTLTDSISPHTVTRTSIHSPPSAGKVSSAASRGMPNISLGTASSSAPGVIPYTPTNAQPIAATPSHASHHSPTTPCNTAGAIPCITPPLPPPRSEQPRHSPTNLELSTTASTTGEYTARTSARTSRVTTISQIVPPLSSSAPAAQPGTVTIPQIPLPLPPPVQPPFPRTLHTAPSFIFSVPVPPPPAALETARKSERRVSGPQHLVPPPAPTKAPSSPRISGQAGDVSSIPPMLPLAAQVPTITAPLAAQVATATATFPITLRRIPTFFHTSNEINPPPADLSGHHSARRLQPLSSRDGSTTSRVAALASPLIVLTTPSE